MASCRGQTQHQTNRVQDSKLLGRRHQPRQLLPAPRSQRQQVLVAVRVQHQILGRDQARRVQQLVFRSQGHLLDSGDNHPLRTAH